MATGATGGTVHVVNPLQQLKRRRAQLDEHLPVDHRLSRVYRIGAGLMGLVLVAFGILGLTHRIGFFDTGGSTVAGLNTNGALSVLSIVVGALLVGGMLIGGNFASSWNILWGTLFLLSGFLNLALLQTDANFLAFKIQNVLFSFVVGLLLLVFGMYGRVSGGLSHDNPYWRARHPEEAERFARGQLHPVAGMTAGRQAARVNMQGAWHGGRGSLGPGTSLTGPHRHAGDLPGKGAGRGAGASAAAGRSGGTATGPTGMGRSAGSATDTRTGPDDTGSKER
ncbi:hypothetical protein GCM10010211_22190 [Streptomyces albospinus]|uniref:DUF4383 domain-containing protein n=1 Tax=Streptomyces albospinus TaxID=285515 RepID=A0ABQ2UW65_9ACTN|nr:DUF4383 domain-containing protein [Streptomyces albospinus]GGU57002.1 hypothetical protein GCM10010211_22190 [Streptomyces albospinus]